MLRPPPYLAALLSLATAACATTATPDAPDAESEAAPASSARTVQPGAPGQATRSLDAAGLSSVEAPAHTPADVAFMQGMIPHHAQALEMTALVNERTQDSGFRQLALRMEISQKDEIALMVRWLESRSEAVGGSHHAHGGAQMPLMPGMLSPEQMDALQGEEDIAFERLFLEYMIQHHQGAITMVAQLFGSHGAAQGSEIFRFANEVDVDQRMEIERMRTMLQARQ